MVRKVIVAGANVRVPAAVGKPSMGGSSFLSSSGSVVPFNRTMVLRRLVASSE
jgi:hypothetical protein